MASNIDQVEQQQEKMLKMSQKSKNLTKVMQSAINKKQIGDIVNQGKNIEKALSDMNGALGKYDKVKKICQDRREKYS